MLETSNYCQLKAYLQHNGDCNETYVDVYCKTKNVCIKGESELKKAYFSGNKK